MTTTKIEMKEGGGGDNNKKKKKEIAVNAYREQ